MIEKCWNCNRSVKLGSGRFINRVPDFNDMQTRTEIHEYPENDFLCSECEDAFDRE